MRCPDCEKFVGMENGEPEVELEVHDNGDGSVEVSAEIRLTRECADCSTELKATDLSVQDSFDIPDESRPCTGRADKGAEKGQHEYTVDVDEANVDETGGGRYKKNIISCDVDFVIGCLNKGCGLRVKGSLRDEAPASSFEESV